jgi:hypothetical protein
MMTLPLQSMDYSCDNCEMLKQACDDDAPDIELSICRYTCANCPARMYKFDAIYALKKSKNVKKWKGSGKKDTATKRYGDVVASLTKQGLSIRNIAKLIGKSTKTVQKVQKELGITNPKRKARRKEE